MMDEEEPKLLLPIDLQSFDFSEKGQWVMDEEGDDDDDDEGEIDWEANEENSLKKETMSVDDQEEKQTSGKKKLHQED